MAPIDPDSGRPSLAIALDIARRLERVGVRYVVGGSLASSLHGEPRSTLDVDVVIDISRANVDALVAALGEAYYIDGSAARDATRHAGTFNAIHGEQAIKVDFFVAGEDAFEAQRLARAWTVQIGPRSEDQIRLDAPEEILLRKLEWYRRGGEVSERQLRDVEGIVAVQGSALDRAHLERWATYLGVSDLLTRVLDPA